MQEKYRFDLEEENISYESLMKFSWYSEPKLILVTYDSYWEEYEYRVYDLRGFNEK